MALPCPDRSSHWRLSFPLLQFLASESQISDIRVICQFGVTLGIGSLFADRILDTFGDSAEAERLFGREAEQHSAWSQTLVDIRVSKSS